MKKIIALILSLALVFTLSACGGKKTLTVYFVPSRDAAEILEATEPLKELLLEELNAQGYNFESIEIQVGSTYEAVGEALGAGTADVGLIPGGTYVLYHEDGVDVILTATRYAITNDSENPAVWNSNEPTMDDKSKMATYYRSIIVAGPSETGRMLADKVNSGQELTWDDVNSATWCVRSSSSSAGYIYPTIWLMDRFGGKTISDLANVTDPGGYGANANGLAAETCDVATFYADARMHQGGAWDALDTDVWEDTDIIGVTAPIYNDTVSVSSATVDEDLKAALIIAFQNIAETEAGAAAIAIYSHKGYQEAMDSDYDNERKAQEIIKGLS